MQLSRRGFIFGAGATLAVIRTPGLLMPVKAIEPVSHKLYLDLEAGTYIGRWVHSVQSVDAAGFSITRMAFELDNGERLYEVINLQQRPRRPTVKDTPT